MNNTKCTMFLSLNSAKNLLCFILIITAAGFSSCANKEQVKSTNLSGPYFGQQLPRLEPEVFAPGIISGGMDESSLTFSADGNELYYSVYANNIGTIVMSKIENGKWTYPEVVPFSGTYREGSPSIHPDGSRLFYYSNRPLGKGTEPEKRYNIWYVDRVSDAWSDPKPVGAPVNTSGTEYCPSVTKDGTLYFTRHLRVDKEHDEEIIMGSKYINGKYAEPERLPDNINSKQYQWNAMIAPDESFLVMPDLGRKDAIGKGANYYVSFRDNNDNWSTFINLGKSVNSLKKNGGNPSFSADGKYFFFIAKPKRSYKRSYKKANLSEIKKAAINNPDSRKNDIYWVDVKIIHNLRPEGF